MNTPTGAGERIYCAAVFDHPGLTPWATHLSFLRNLRKVSADHPGLTSVVLAELERRFIPARAFSGNAGRADHPGLTPWATHLTFLWNLRKVSADHPGLTSVVPAELERRFIPARAFSGNAGRADHPGLTPWANISRSCGTRGGMAIRVRAFCGKIVRRLSSGARDRRRWRVLAGSIRCGGIRRPSVGREAYRPSDL